MQTIRQQVATALDLDATEDLRAFGWYMKSVHLITDELQAYETFHFPTNSFGEISKLYGLLKKCVERSEIVIREAFDRHQQQQFQKANNNNNNNSNNLNLNSTTNNSTPNNSNQFTTVSSVATSPQTQIQQQNQTNTNQQSQQQQTQQQQQQQQSTNSNPNVTLLHLDGNEIASLSHKLREPFLEAENKNIKLKQEYARQIQLLKNNKSSSPFLVNRRISEMNLSFARESAENYAIARRKHEAIVSKVNEVEKLERQMAFVYDSNWLKELDRKSEDKNNQIQIHDSLNSRASTNSNASSNNEKATTQDLKDANLSNLFSQHHQMSRKEILVRKNIIALLCDATNPIGKKTMQFILAWKHKAATSYLQTSSASVTTLERLFEEVKNEIHTFIQTTAALVFREMPRLEESDVCSITLNAVEDTISKNIFHNLFEFYKLKYATDDQLILKQSENARNAKVTPTDLDLSAAFWTPELAKSIETNLPNQIRELTAAQSPLEKLQCLNDLSISIAENVQKILQKPLAADQLIPILTHIVIQAGLTHAWSECIFLQDFINDYLAAGELGYALVSFQTCLQAIKMMVFHDNVLQK